MAVGWNEFEARAPELASAGRSLIYPLGPSGPGLGFLATTRADGGPRVHPVCPAIHDGILCVFVIGDSPKRADLERDGRYAFHVFPAEKDDESFYCTGPALRISDPARRRAAESSVVHNVREDEILFELLLERVLYTTWINPRQPDTRPVYRRWRAEPDQSTG
jgi:hypothetical protein